MKTYLKDLTAKEIIKRLKNGEIAISESNKLIRYKLIDGILCEVGERYPNVIGAPISPYDNLYFETEDDIKEKPQREVKLIHCNRYDFEKELQKYLDDGYELYGNLSACYCSPGQGVQVHQLVIKKNY